MITRAAHHSPFSLRESVLWRLTELAGRLLLAAQFLLSGVQKGAQYSGTVAYMESSGVPGELLPAVIAFEIATAIALILGWKTRVASLLLAGFTFIAGVIFHGDLRDPQQLIHLLKNLSIVGGFLVLAAYGAGPFSLDEVSRSFARRSASSTIV